MMFPRFLISMAVIAGFHDAATAADFGSQRARSFPSVIGASVTMEGGVRVIRPFTLDPGPLVVEDAMTEGRIIYHGAAIYRVPGPWSNARHKQLRAQ
jgi:hypothetical protein